MHNSHIVTDESLLDVRHHEHIVAVCGVLPEYVSADADGWLLNDFFFLAHALHRADRKGRFIWLTCIPPAILVERYALFAAENSTPNQLPTCIRICDREEIADAFIEATKAACRRAQRPRHIPGLSRTGEEEVLVILLGHGQFGFRGIEIGRHKNPLGLPEPTAERYIAENGVHGVWRPERCVTAEKLARIAVAYPEVPVAVMVPAYWLGRWELYVDFGFAADGDSWLQVERRTGSLFSFDIALDHLGEESDSIDQLQVTSVVRATLLGLYPDSQVGGGPSAGGLVSETVLREGNGELDWDAIDHLPVSSSLLDRVGGSQKALHRVLRLQSQAYLRSYPGHGLHDLAGGVSMIVCLLGDPGEDDLEELAIYLHHQNCFSTLASNLIQVMQLGLFYRFDRWDYPHWVARRGLVPNWVLDEVVQWIGTYWPRELTADPGLAWSKPIYYLGAALVEQGLTNEEMVARLESGRRYIMKQSARVEEFVLKDLGNRLGCIITPPEA